MTALSAAFEPRSVILSEAKDLIKKKAGHWPPAEGGRLFFSAMDPARTGAPRRHAWAFPGWGS
jgi:hypothetical protein